MLQPYLERFPRGQILVLKFERILSAPDRVAAEVHARLGVEPRPRDAEALGIVNPSDSSAADMPDEVRRDLYARYREPNRRLAAILGPEFEWSE